MGKASSNVLQATKSSANAAYAEQDELESDLLLQQHDSKPCEYIRLQPDLADKLIKAIQKEFKKIMHFACFELNLAKLLLRLVIARQAAQKGDASPTIAMCHLCLSLSRFLSS